MVLFLLGHFSVKPNVRDELSDEDKIKYGSAKVFEDKFSIGDAGQHDPIIVCGPEEDIRLSKDEMGLLTLGPKFCILNDLVEETFEKEIEECIVKLRWETMNEEM